MDRLETIQVAMGIINSSTDGSNLTIDEIVVKVNEIINNLNLI